MSEIEEALVDVEDNKFMRGVWDSLGGQAAILGKLVLTGKGDLPSIYPVTDFASASIAAASLAVAEMLGHHAATVPEVTVNRRLASFWFGMSIRPVGWTLPAAWDSIAGDYRTKDGWIRLHTNAPHHRVAAEHVLGHHPDKEAMSRSVDKWSAAELEIAIIEAGGCAAEMKSRDQWADHQQGQALAAEPLVDFAVADQAVRSSWEPTQDRPLAGLKVLDLTRVLAGPVASRFLAGYGADVLRIDPPDWDEPGVIPEVTLGKNCARLDLEKTADRRQFEEMLSQSDILMHGYRPGALEGLGYGDTARRSISPGLIDISLSAYGWTGPWSHRRGFDSLVQMSAGIAYAGMRWKGIDTPVPLPVQALDQATGYFMAAAAIRGITRRMTEGKSTMARLSLARTAQFLTDSGESPSTQTLSPENAEDLAQAPEYTAWGEARRLQAPATVAGAPMYWQHPARALGSSPPSWARTRNDKEGRISPHAPLP